MVPSGFLLLSFPRVEVPPSRLWRAVSTLYDGEPVRLGEREVER
jgi:hypothetical protein